MSDEFHKIMHDWMNLHGVEDKDNIRKNRYEQKKEEKSARKRNRKQPGAVLDLHGMKLDEARNTVRHFLYMSRKNGLKRVVIIHGKGYNLNSALFITRCQEPTGNSL